MNHRVVVTGMGGLSPIGLDWGSTYKNLKDLKSGVSAMPDWAEYEGLRTNIAGKIKDFKLPSHYPRKKTRSMGRVAEMSAVATEDAIKDAGLFETEFLTDGRTGIAYGSSTGSPSALQTFATKMMVGKSLKGIPSTNYIKMMSHTCAANLGQFFGVKGRIVTTCSACTSASQAIGFGYENIKFGLQKIMLSGGAEELSPSEAVVFDILYATSTKNDIPHLTPTPFDVDRDGLVIGEGAGTLVLEELEHAKGRGATIYAEVVGHGANSDGMHITNPDSKGMQKVMEMALEIAGLSPEQIGYVSAHGTATETGDIAESNAMFRIFGKNTPTSSMKSYIGHTLGACGALEAWVSIQMMRNKWFAPTLHLKNIDPRCGDLDYIVGDGKVIDTEYVMSNNFAFGGINTSLIFKRWS